MRKAFDPRAYVSHVRSFLGRTPATGLTERLYLLPLDFGDDLTLRWPDSHLPWQWSSPTGRGLLRSIYTIRSMWAHSNVRSGRKTAKTC